MVKCVAWKEEHGEGFAPFNLAMDQNIEYKCKVKLHGSNCGVVIEKAETKEDQEIIVRAQSRSQLVDKHTMVGKIVFASKANTSYFSSLLSGTPFSVMTIYGEWCGPKVQKGVGVSKLGKHKETQQGYICAIFCIRADDQLIFEPSQIREILTKNETVALPTGLHILPWYTGAVDTAAEQSFSLNFLDEKQLNGPVDTINAFVDSIDQKDPWVFDTFGVEGPGEGLVFYPISLAGSLDSFQTLDPEIFAAFAFKAKGEAHRVTKSKTSVQVKPQSAASAEKLLDIVLTEARLQQGVQEVGGFEKKLTGKFTSWVKADVQKECQDEMEASGLKWKELNGPLGKRCSSWYIKQVQASSS